MINKTIILENKKYNLKEVFILKASSISTIYDINKKPKDIVDKYYLYESFNGHILVFADYDIETDKDVDENNNLQSMIDYFLDLNKIDSSFGGFIFLHEHPSIIYIEKRIDSSPKYVLSNAVGLYEEVMYESPQNRMIRIADYCTEAINYKATDIDDDDYDDL